MIDAITKESRVAAFNLANDAQRWPDTPPLRKVLGDLAHQQKWIKRVDYSRKAFEFSLPRLPGGGVLKRRLALLWDWVQSHE
jgi:putative ATP-dependent endonuclease of the OLD family